eukprot:3689980-Prymnesium_polylepis.1
MRGQGYPVPWSASRAGSRVTRPLPSRQSQRHHVKRPVALHVAEVAAVSASSSASRETKEQRVTLLGERPGATA